MEELHAVACKATRRVLAYLAALAAIQWVCVVVSAAVVAVLVSILAGDSATSLPAHGFAVFRYRTGLAQVSAGQGGVIRRALAVAKMESLLQSAGAASLPIAGIVRRTFNAVFAIDGVELVYAADLRVTTVISAEVAVVAVRGLPPAALAITARVVESARVAVVALPCLRLVVTARLRHASIRGAGIAVVADSHIGVTVAVVVFSVADLLGHMVDLLVQWLAIRGVLLPVVIIVEIARVSLAIVVEVELVRVGKPRTVVFSILESVAVGVQSTVLGAGIRVLADPCLALTVPAPYPAVVGARIGRFNKAAEVVAAVATIYRTLLGSLPSLANTVSAGRKAVLRAVLIVLDSAADGITARATVLCAQKWVLPALADAVTAGRHAVHCTKLRVLSRFALTIATGCGTVVRTEFVTLLQAAEAVSAAAAVHRAVDGTLAPLADPVATRNLAVSGASASVGTILQRAAHTVATVAAIHGAVQRALSVDAEPVAARAQALLFDGAGDADSLVADIIQCTGITVVARIRVEPVQTFATVGVAKVHGAVVGIVTVNGVTNALSSLALVVQRAGIAVITAGLVEVEYAARFRVAGIVGAVITVVTFERFACHTLPGLAGVGCGARISVTANGAVRQLEPDALARLARDEFALGQLLEHVLTFLVAHTLLDHLFHQFRRQIFLSYLRSDLFGYLHIDRLRNQVLRGLGNVRFRASPAIGDGYSFRFTRARGQRGDEQNHDSRLHSDAKHDALQVALQSSKAYPILAGKESGFQCVVCWSLPPSLDARITQQYTSK